MYAQLIVNVLSKRSKAPFAHANNCLIGAFRLPNCRAANGRPNYCAIVHANVRLYVRLFTFIIVSSTFSVYTRRHAANKWFYFFRLHKRGDQPMARLGRVRTLSYALNNWRARSTSTYHPKLWHSSRRKAVGTSTEYNSARWYYNM